MGLARTGLYTEKRNGSDHTELSLTLATLEFFDSILSVTGVRTWCDPTMAHENVAVPWDLAMLDHVLVPIPWCFAFATMRCLNKDCLLGLQTS
jgi:hypothetical protein